MSNCFAALCGAAPVPASSGKITRHRLSRGGDRAANNALYRIALVRMSAHPQTRGLVAQPVRVGAGGDQQLGGGVGAHAVGGAIVGGTLGSLVFPPHQSVKSARAAQKRRFCGYSNAPSPARSSGC
jgi:Transposase IS116/IS110/IS902 family